VPPVIDLASSIGILTAMKAGFNEIISGLEMIERKTHG
jgi:hypothetical protein